MNKIVDVLTTPLVTFPLILTGMNAIIYQIAGKKIGKIWGAKQLFGLFQLQSMFGNLILCSYFKS